MSQYFVRSRGKRVGPLTLEKIQAMARRGRLGKHVEVSTNGRSWKRADEFPEVFGGGGNAVADDMGAAGYTGFDNIEDVAAPPQSGGRRRRATGSRNRRGTARDSGGGAAGPADQLADPLMDAHDIDAGAQTGAQAGGGAVAADGGEAAGGRRRVTNRRRRASPKTHAPQAGDDLFDDGSAPAEESRPSRRSRRRGGSGGTRAPSFSADYDAPLPTSAPLNVPDFGQNDEDEEPEKKKKKKKKKKKGMFGLFSGSDNSDELDGISPHVKKLRRMHKKLDALSFKIKDMIFVGSGQQELRATGHSDSGDGIQTLALLTLIAFQTKSSDLHLEPKQDGYEARVRVDGILVPLVEFPQQVANRVSGVIKVLCEIDFAGRSGIQEGSYSIIAPGKRVDFRVSFTPAVHGQKVAIRILDLSNSPQSAAQLGAPRGITNRLQAVMEQNQGMVLLCGPTGSGKTTTLYSLIRGINVKQRNVMTLEDPVEYQIPGVTQTSVDKDHGKGFADMLRALLRQDPDVILLGEIRDKETARIAMQATMTGHLVLSTLHAQDTLNTVFRLLDLGADPNMVGSALDLVLSQRLVRVLCQECARRRRPSKQESQMLGRFARDMIFEPGGCIKCLGTGFNGRRAIFELLTTTEEMKDVILREPTLQDLRRAAGKNFVTLRQHGYSLVGAGITSIAEINRVIGIT